MSASLAVSAVEILLTLLCTWRLSSGAGGFAEFSLTSEPADIVVTRERSIVLDCGVHFVPSDGSTRQQVEIVWLHDGVPVVINAPRRQLLSNGSLYMESQSVDQGWYQCRVSVAGAGILLSRKAYVQHAYVNRSFTAEPQNTSAYLADNVMFTCIIGGSPQPAVEWVKDDIDIGTGNSNYVFHESGRIFEIRSVQFTDFGRYRCKVNTGSDRPKVSATALLVQNSDGAAYQGVTPRFVLQPSDKTVFEGSAAVLYCAANGRDRSGTRPKLTWLKDGLTVDVSQEGRFSLVGEGSLRIDSVMEDDAGLYTCRASNMEESIDAHAILQVYVAPKFRQRPRNSVGFVNSDKDLICDVYSNPSPVISWLKDGIAVVPDDYVQIIDSRTLRILGLLPTDAGMYQCMATAGEVGSLQASAQLIVIGNIEPFSSLGSPSAPTDLTAPIVSLDFLTLSWRPPDESGQSDIIAYSIWWTEEGSSRQRELNTTTLEANIQHLKSATKYSLKVFAINSHGYSPESAAIGVSTQREASVPDSPTNLQAVARSPSSILVTWNPPLNIASEVSGYSVYYYDVGSAATVETEVNVTATMCALVDLRKFHQYSIRVVAFNSNGTGTSTQEVNCRTYSDVPAAPPQNASVEALSSTSIIVRWEPPPEDSQNGVITGYKIRYRQGKERQHSIVTVDGGQTRHSLTDLVRGTEYSIRVQAMTVNGTGQATSWMSTETFLSDLDESTVPGEPTSLRVRPLTDSIVVSWTAPANADNNVMIRGYILGYGIGVPDVYRQLLDAKQRYHTIRGLASSSEYVISLKAFNNAGHGKPIYETTITREEKTPEPPTPIMPPVGLKAMVLSPNTIVLTWTDTTLGRSQRVNDNRVYTVRYQPKSGSSGLAAGRKQKFINSTILNVHIDDLKPDTEYEFSVRIVKGRRQSAWSLSVFNKTYEMVPTSSVRDLTPVSIEGQPTAISLNWQPPRQTNGQITGYQVFYTTDAALKDRDWVLEDVNGERLSVTIRDLSLETTYYLKIQARNNAGYGPMSPTVIFRTPSFDGKGGGIIEMPDDYGRPVPPRGSSRDYFAAVTTTAPAAASSNTLLWIIISVIGGITVIIVIIIGAIVLHCHCAKKKQTAHKNVNYMPANKGKPAAMELKPPDLWINYDHRNPEKAEEADEGTAMMSHGCRDERDPGDIDSIDRYRHMLNCPKPVMIPVDQPQPPLYRDHMMYPGMHQMGLSVHPPASVPRVNAGDLLSNPSTAGAVPYIRPEQRGDARYQKPDVTPDTSVHGAPSSPSDNEPNELVLKAPEKASSPTDTNVMSSLAPAFSTEELTTEMANLEGLMKDLSVIAQQQQEFDC